VGVATPAGRYYMVDGPLADAVTPPGWSLSGTPDGFSVFRAEGVPQTAWLSPARGTASLVSSSTNEATIAATSTTATTLVWNTAYDAGWHATLVSANGSTKSLKVTRVGLVQGVEIPPGSNEVRFTYEPVGFRLGALVTAVTLVILAAIGAVMLERRRRRRRIERSGASARGVGRTKGVEKPGSRRRGGEVRELKPL